jgi:hypothetical protein
MGPKVAAIERCATGRFAAVRMTLTPVTCAAVIALASVSAGACSGGDELDDRITRIDGPAVVDEDRDGQPDG